MSVATRRVRNLCLLALAVAGLAACKHTPPEPVFKDSLQTASAKVETVEPVTRLIALRTPAGERLWVTAAPEVRNFAQIRVGDTVTVQYYKAIAAQVKPKGTADSAAQNSLATYSAAPGARPAGAIGHTVVETVKIQSVDTSANTVTFQRADGTVHSVTVASPEGQTFIRGLRSGDDVDVAYSEAVAVAVQPSR
jgi:hypothetical protein